MSLNKVIITAAESDVILASDSVWVALTDAVKEGHIAKASVYMQVEWTCADIDWTDDTTITDDIKEACAYYANADFVGNLYPSVDADGTAIGRLTQKTQNADVLETTYKYSDKSASTASNPLAYPAALMGTECVFNSSSVELIRV